MKEVVAAGMRTGVIIRVNKTDRNCYLSGQKILRKEGDKKTGETIANS